MTAPHGIDPAAVVAAIRARAERLRTGSREPDGNKLGLVVEGGGLRGVCSGGGIVALGHLGYTSLFDEVYGTSAGALNAAYFLADQTTLGIRIYYEDMVRREIVNPMRAWRVLDIDRLFSRAVTGDKALDLDAILASPSRLHIAMIDAGAGAGVLANTRALASAGDLLTALKAATAIPVLYNRRFDVDGRACMDAGIANPVPIESALADGCTHVLVLLSRPESYRRPAAGRASRWLFDRVCARGSAALSKLYADQWELDARQRALAFGRTPPPGGARIATVCTDEGETVDRLTTDAGRLRAAAVAYGRKTLRLFGADADDWTLAPPST